MNAYEMAVELQEEKGREWDKRAAACKRKSDDFDYMICALKNIFVEELKHFEKVGISFIEEPSRIKVCRGVQFIVLYEFIKDTQEVACSDDYRPMCDGIRIEVKRNLSSFMQRGQRDYEMFMHSTPIERDFLVERIAKDLAEYI